MKFTVNTKDILAMAQRISIATDQKSPIESLKAVGINADSGVVFLNAMGGTCIAQGMVVLRPEDIGNPGETAVNAAALRGALAACPESDVTVESKGNSVRVSSGRFVATIETTQFEPGQLDLPDTEYFEGAEIARVGRIVAGACSTEVHRPTLCGVHFSGTQAVAADTHRLRTRPSNAKCPASVPPVFFDLLTDDCEVAFDDTCGYIRSEEFCAKVQLLAGSFPNWERVVPQECLRFTVDRERMIEACSRVMLGMPDSHRIYLGGEGGLIYVDTLKFLDSVEVEGEIASFCMNGKYLIAALKALTSETVEFHMSDASRPLMMLGAEGEVEVIMPMSVDGWTWRKAVEKQGLVLA